MDLLARLMYGGRISLLIGFVVVAIELVIGVIVGGVAGFFGGWIDNLLMRFVDIIYCIPSMPLYLILGSIMDYYKASSTVRIYMLCIIMSIVGWVGIARIVRGQILSLREQEFMTAAEATGISVHRRIFKHLVPNVIPQLVVFASMGIGDVILSESTLSFLGLGIKYPAASWGSIINAVTDSYVMTNYLFVWIPAGMLILLTVLAFNFIGDGLRDAFDPKMKR
jgi:peptide/nickel transport system permease protein